MESSNEVEVVVKLEAPRNEEIVDQVDTGGTNEVRKFNYLLVFIIFNNHIVIRKGNTF